MSIYITLSAADFNLLLLYVWVDDGDFDLSNAIARDLFGIHISSTLLTYIFGILASDVLMATTLLTFISDCTDIICLASTDAVAQRGKGQPQQQQY